MKVRQLLTAVCMHVALVHANAFIAPRKPKRVSLSHLKQDAGDIFSQQLRMSADLLRLIGQLQVQLAHQPLAEDASSSYMQKLRMYGTQMQQYKMQLDNLLEPMVCTQVLAFVQEGSVSGLLGHLSVELADIQHKLIGVIEELFDGTSSVFCKSHNRSVPGVISMAKGYTKHFHALQCHLQTIKA